MKLLTKPKFSDKNHQFPQIIAIFIASLSAVSEGLLFSWTSPAIPELLKDEALNISLEEASYFTVIPSISMVVSAPLFSMLINTVGRKKGLLLIAVPQLLAWVLTGLANNIWIFYAARFVSGVGDAALFATCPVYVCEIAEPKVRGSWGNLVAVGTYTGIFLINVIGAFYSLQTTVLICACVPLVFVALFSFMPESPYYFLMKGREEDARKSLKWLRWTDNVEAELVSLKADVARQTSEKGTMKELFSIVSNRRAMIMCLLIRAAQQLSGLSAFELYTQYLFQEAGGDVDHKLSAIIFSGVLALGVSLSAFIVERFGRRPLIIFSCFGCAVVLAIEAVYFTLRQFTDLDLSDFGWLPLVGMLAYIVVCASGIGILPTLIAGEIFSASIKGKATSIMNVGLGFYVLVGPKLFQTLTYNFGMYAPFYFFSSCCIIFGTCCCFYVIETKDKTLEEIQQELKGNKTLKNGCEKC